VKRHEEAVKTQRDHRLKAKQLNIQSQRLEETVDRLQDELAADTPQTGALDDLQVQLKGQQDEETLYSNQYQDCITEKDRLDQANRELKNQLNNIDAEIKMIESKIKKAKNREQNAEEARYHGVLKKNEAYATVDYARQSLDEAKEEREKQKQTVVEWTAKASEFCARVAVHAGETCDSIEAKLIKMNEQIEQNKRQ
jgi:chromosome segregation ATPase